MSRCSIEDKLKGSCGCGPVEAEPGAQEHGPTLTRFKCELNTISKIELKDKEGEIIVANSLWAKKPTLVFAVRRPGCLLCREQAAKLWKLKPEFDKLQLRLVAVLHEWNEIEVQAFCEGFWPGEVYLDEKKAFYAALGGGEVQKGSIFSVLNPFSQLWKNVGRARTSGLVKEHNFVGDGTVLGGLLVVKRADLGVEYAYPERALGDHAPLDEVIEAAQAASAARIDWLAQRAKRQLVAAATTSTTPESALASTAES